MSAADSRVELVQKALSLERQAWERERDLLQSDKCELQAKVDALSVRLQQARAEQNILQEELRSSLEENAVLKKDFEKERHAWERERELLMQSERDLQVRGLNV
jgi:hypothetical protein